MSERSRRVRDRIKWNRMIGTPARPTALAFAQRLVDVLSDTNLRDVFRDADVAVPVPRSSPLVEGGLWPALELARALVTVGLVPRVDPLLERRSRIRKSAFSARGERPSPREHFDSLLAARQRSSGSRVLLVDDIVTKGATLLGAAARLRAEAPGVEVRAFAAIRTLGFQPEIERIQDPCLGTIRLLGEEADRRP